MGAGRIALVSYILINKIDYPAYIAGPKLQFAPDIQFSHFLDLCSSLQDELYLSDR
jgi:hypothetical protein